MAGTSCEADAPSHPAGESGGFPVLPLSSPDAGLSGECGRDRVSPTWPLGLALGLVFPAEPQTASSFRCRAGGQRARPEPSRSRAAAGSHRGPSRPPPHSRGSQPLADPDAALAGEWQLRHLCPPPQGVSASRVSGVVSPATSDDLRAWRVQVLSSVSTGHTSHGCDLGQAFPAWAPPSRLREGPAACLPGLSPSEAWSHGSGRSAGFGALRAGGARAECATVPWGPGQGGAGSAGLLRAFTTAPCPLRTVCGSGHVPSSESLAAAAGAVQDEAAPRAGGRRRPPRPPCGHRCAPPLPETERACRPLPQHTPHARAPWTGSGEGAAALAGRGPAHPPAWLLPAVGRAASAAEHA